MHQPLMLCGILMTAEGRVMFHDCQAAPQLCMPAPNSPAFEWVQLRGYQMGKVHKLSQARHHSAHLIT